MDDPRLEEILRRLDYIERRLEEHDHDDYRPRRRGRRHRCRCHDDDRWDDDPRERRGRGQPFEEKRVVDLIVDLVTKRVDELLWRYEQRRAEALKQSAEPETDAGDSVASED